MQKNVNYNEAFGPQEGPFPRVGHLDRGPHSLRYLRKVPVARRGVTLLVSGWGPSINVWLWCLLARHGWHWSLGFLSPCSWAPPHLTGPFSSSHSVPGVFYHVAFSCILRRQPWQFGTNLFSPREQLFWFPYWAYYLWLKVLFWY